MKKVVILGFVAMVFSGNVLAGECVMSIHRTACPGKETDAFKPYQGKNPTEEKKSVADQAACKALAEKTAKIIRKGTLTAKKVTATFDGKDAGSSEDKAACR